MKNYSPLFAVLAALVLTALPLSVQAYNECVCNRYGTDGLCIDESCYTHTQSVSSYTHYLPSHSTPTYYTYPNYGRQYYYPGSYGNYNVYDRYHYPRGHYRPYTGRTYNYRPYYYGGGGYYNPRTRYNDNDYYYRRNCNNRCSSGNGSFHYYDYHYRY